MAEIKAHTLAVVLLAAAAALLLSSSPAEAACGIDLRNLSGKCGEFVRIGDATQNPSAACCEEVRKVDIPCLCKILKPGLEQIMDIRKCIYVAWSCGNPFTVGSNCGPYHIGE